MSVVKKTPKFAEKKFLKQNSKILAKMIPVKEIQEEDMIRYDDEKKNKKKENDVKNKIDFINSIFEELNLTTDSNKCNNTAINKTNNNDIKNTSVSLRKKSLNILNQNTTLDLVYHSHRAKLAENISEKQNCYYNNKNVIDCLHKDDLDMELPHSSSSIPKKHDKTILEYEKDFDDYSYGNNDSNKHKRNNKFDKGENHKLLTNGSIKKINTNTSIEWPLRNAKMIVDEVKENDIKANHKKKRDPLISNKQNEKENISICMLDESQRKIQKNQIKPVFSPMSINENWHKEYSIKDNNEYSMQSSKNNCINLMNDSNILVPSNKQFSKKSKQAKIDKEVESEDEMSEKHKMKKIIVDDDNEKENDKYSSPKFEFAFKLEKLINPQKKAKNMKESKRQLKSQKKDWDLKVDNEKEGFVFDDEETIESRQIINFLATNRSVNERKNPIPSDDTCPKYMNFIEMNKDLNSSTKRLHKSYEKILTNLNSKVKPILNVISSTTACKTNNLKLPESRQEDFVNKQIKKSSSRKNSQSSSRFFFNDKTESFLSPKNTNSKMEIMCDAFISTASNIENFYKEISSLTTKITQAAVIMQDTLSKIENIQLKSNYNSGEKSIKSIPKSHRLIENIENDKSNKYEKAYDFNNWNTYSKRESYHNKKNKFGVYQKQDSQ